MSEIDEPVRALLTPEAVRERCSEIFAAALRGETRYLSVSLPNLESACVRVVEEIRRNYPDGRVPFHSRWRHFELGGRDYWNDILAHHSGMATDDVARARIDLAFVSVLLDAGAGPDWIYKDAATGVTLGRSEGLALASLRMFESGAFSARPKLDPLRADHERLQALTPADLAVAFQVDANNPLVGLEPRVALLNNLGAAIKDAPTVFAGGGAIRPGHLFGYLAQKSTNEHVIPARLILTTILEHLGHIWPSARRVGGVAIADVGIHPLLRRDDETNGVVPFHKLSQWLSYSLIEPLEDGGLTVRDPDALTGLAEYRNGGLLLDAGALRLNDAADWSRVHQPTDELVVEWRALTIALLDRLALRVRELTGMNSRGLPLAAILQGGTWSAGRRIAAEMRPGGGPPLNIATNGTQF